MPDDLLSVKELAGRLRRCANYVWAMRRRGFPMPGGRATVGEARRWLRRNPKPMAAGVKK